ncbi:hypothetical protein GCM10025876_18660 [Demequina litorisediminis]|uniref:Secreted protein n=1 Tax=Demequina litorisediminis TaxID=1849022 RepID=A0ABQ6IG06_9MICO|nr:hypothetical protein GCM10025876_18660 [Demequina litorisediminis]
MAWAAVSLATTDTDCLSTAPVAASTFSVTLSTALLVTVSSLRYSPVPPSSVGTAMLSGPSTPASVPPAPPVYSSRVLDSDSGKASGSDVKDSVVVCDLSKFSSAETDTTALPGPTTRSSMAWMLEAVRCS